MDLISFQSELRYHYQDPVLLVNVGIHASIIWGEYTSDDDNGQHYLVMNSRTKKIISDPLTGCPKWFNLRDVDPSTNHSVKSTAGSGSSSRPGDSSGGKKPSSDRKPPGSTSGANLPGDASSSRPGDSSGGKNPPSDRKPSGSTGGANLPGDARSLGRGGKKRDGFLSKFQTAITKSFQK